MVDGATADETDERSERIAAQLHRAGITALDLYAIIGARQAVSQDDLDRRIATGRRLADEGRVSDRARDQLPLVERVLGDPVVREVYDRERALMEQARASTGRPAQEATPRDAHPTASAERAGSLERSSAQRALMRGDIELALRYGDEAMEVDPSAASAVTLASILRRAGQLEEAEALARRALDMAGAGTETTLCLARVLVDAGRADEALALIDQIPDAPGAAALARRLRAPGTSPEATPPVADG